MREVVRKLLKDVKNGFSIILTFTDKYANLLADKKKNSVSKEIELLFLQARLIQK